MTQVIDQVAAATPDMIQRGVEAITQAIRNGNPIASAGLAVIGSGVLILSYHLIDGRKVFRFAGTCAHTITDRITAMVRVAIDPTLVRRVIEIRDATPSAEVA